MYFSFFFFVVHVYVDEWEKGSGEDGLGENEFVVGKILDRQLMYPVEDRFPQEEDYLYLVSWDGYGPEENTWEPYEHLKHCTLKLKEFHNRLKYKSLRNRKGKR